MDGVRGGCDFVAHFEDVTFDGKEDLIISVGDSKTAHYYCTYIYENNGFRYESTFEKIPIPEELLHDWDRYWEWYEGLQ